MENAGTLTERVAWLIDDTWGSRKAAAEALEAHPALVSRWATNPERTPSEETIQKLAEATHSTPWWIRYGLGTPHPDESPDDALLALVIAHSTPELVLLRVRPDEFLRATFRTAIADGWGEEAIAELTKVARKILHGRSILDLIA